MHSINIHRCLIIENEITDMGDCFVRTLTITTDEGDIEINIFADERCCLTIYDEKME